MFRLLGTGDRLQGKDALSSARAAFPVLAQLRHLTGRAARPLSPVTCSPLERP